MVGIRNMLDATSLSSNTNVSTVPFTGTVDSRTRWFDTLTARGGYLVTPQVLLYAQGGAAWTNTNITFLDGSGAQLGETSNDRTGWTVGAGVEWRFAPQWSVFAEYNFMGFGTQSATFTGCGGACVDTDWDALNCGGCGIQCDALEFCTWGTCDGVCIGCE